MLKAIEIENFKSIGDRVRFELRPITLLFGANSSGKSTVIQALHYALELLENRNPDPDRTLMGGESVDLGGFENIVHGRDKSKSIILRFDMELTDEDWPDFGLRNDMARQMAENWVYAEPHDFEGTIQTVKTATVILECSWSTYQNKPLIKRYTVALNDVAYFRFEVKDDSGVVEFVFVNNSVPENMRLEREWSLPDIDQQPEWWEKYRTLDLGAIENMCMNGEYQLTSRLCAIPQWDKPLEFDAESLKKFVEDLGLDVKENQLDILTSIRQLSQICVGPAQILMNTLQNIRYLGPLRKKPHRGFIPARSEDKSRWANGLAAWDLLLKKGPDFAQTVSAWMAGEERINCGYTIEIKEFKELDVKSPLMVLMGQENWFDSIDEIRQMVENLPTKRHLTLVEEATSLECDASDIGEGISQVVPVVVGALDGDFSIFAVEQPELHIHPAMQVALGDLFIEESKRDGRMFLVETHSEHLMLRLIRRIRETYENELQAGVVGLIPENVAVHYVAHRQDAMTSTLLEIDNTGEFKSQWPEGFFDERGEELF